MVTGRFRSCHTSCAIQFPPDAFTQVFRLDCEVAAQATFDNRIVTNRPITIQTHTRQMDYQRVSRRSSFNVERTGLRITTEHPRYTFFVRSARIHCGGVNGVTGPDRQHRFIVRRKLTIENCRRELMPLWCTRASLWNFLRGERMGSRMLLVLRIREDNRAGYRVAVDGAVAFLRSVFVRREEVKLVSRQRSLQLVATESAGQLVSALGQVQFIVDGRAEQIGGCHPSARNRVLCHYE